MLSILTYRNHFIPLPFVSIKKYQTSLRAVCLWSRRSRCLSRNCSRWLPPIQFALRPVPAVTHPVHIRIYPFSFRECGFPCNSVRLMCLFGSTAGPCRHQDLRFLVDNEQIGSFYVKPGLLPYCERYHFSVRDSR